MKDSSELVEGPMLVNMHILYIYISTVISISSISSISISSISLM